MASRRVKKGREEQRRGPRGMRAKDQLSALHVRPTKERGQNFIIEPSVIQEIVAFGAPQEGERVLEIGPGLGALTGALAARGSLTVIEIEPNFCRELAGKYPHIEIVNADVRTVDFTQLCENAAPEKVTPFTVFGNLPYAFSTEIVFHLLAHARVIKRAILLLQREFAERMAAPPGGREYGRLSIAAQLSADITLGPIFPGHVFHPPASVESAVVQLSFLPEPKVHIEDRKWFDKVVKAAFLQRRKKLANSLRSAGILSTGEIALGLEAAKIDGDRRAETLAIQEFADLATALAGARK